MDNITTPATGVVLATDEIAGVQYPRSKVGFGVDGAFTDVSADAPLPVAIVSGGGAGGSAGDASAANQATEIARLTSILSSVDGLEGLLTTANSLLGGTLTVALPDGAAADATVAALSAKLPASLGPKAVSTSLSIVPATSSDMATNAGIASALAGVSFYPATQPVSATALPLPAGAATAANQATAITALQNSAPADDLFAITPSDTVALATVPKALLVTVAGNVAVRGTGAAPVTLAVTAGQILPIRARYVYATNTTATVVGLV